MYNAVSHASIRWKILLPMLLAALGVAATVAVLSWQLGRQRALLAVQERFNTIARTVGSASFPLTDSVTRSLAALSDCELVVLRNSGRISTSTLSAGSANELTDSFANLRMLGSENPVHAQVAGTEYLVFEFSRQTPGLPDEIANRVLVLFDRTQIIAASRRAAVLPLATGLSTVLLLGALAMGLAKQLTTRVARLKSQVKQIAAGDFMVAADDRSQDELGQLGTAVNSMSRQLRELWQEVHRQQGQKLLHLLAASMAHQLRNTLSGAKLSLELHQKKLANHPSEEVDVALKELAVAEEYIQRILLVGSGEQLPDTAGNVAEILNEVRESHAVVAGHLGVELAWHADASLEQLVVADGPSLRAAVSNLLLNAIQAGDCVSLTATQPTEDCCSIQIVDNGHGVATSVRGQLFEPFVTTKPEGMGLGLAVVKRAADKLGGTVEWRREFEHTVFQRTVFEFRCQLQPLPPAVHQLGP